MESNGQQEKTKTVSKDQVIAKLKDDGDFDNLRLKIIRKVKDNVCVLLSFLVSLP